MKILFVHQNFPGQFVHLAREFAADLRNEVMSLSRSADPHLERIRHVQYSFLRDPSEKPHFLLREEEEKILYAESCAAAAWQLKNEGFIPEVIVAHSGWGEPLFLKDVFPTAKLIIYAEYHYSAEGQDFGFDPEDGPATFAQRCLLRIRNFVTIGAMQAADLVITPTVWQRSTFPAWLHTRITVVHEGIQQWPSNSARSLHLETATEILQLDGRMPILTFVARNLEPVRGFHIFMRMLPSVLREVPDARVLIVGGDDVSYGRRPPSASCWREEMLKEMSDVLDMGRIHFLGKLPYQTYRRVLEVSKVHYYWTSPFVLSWSFLEAASAGPRVVAGATPPVLEFADRLSVDVHDPFDIDAGSQLIINRLVEAEDEATRNLRREKFPAELHVANCVLQQKKLINKLLAG